MTSTAHAFSGRDFADIEDEAVRAAFGKAKAHDPAADWPEPDWSILSASRRPAVSLPTETLPALFGAALPVLEAVAAGTSTALDYPACAYLACCASLIGGKRRVRPYSTSNWAEPPILWIGIVGDPSSRKSPALEAIIDPLRMLERDGAETHKAALRDWREADTKAKAVRAQWERDIAKAIKDGCATVPTMPPAAAEPDEDPPGVWS